MSLNFVPIKTCQIGEGGFKIDLLGERTQIHPDPASRMPAPAVNGQSNAELLQLLQLMSRLYSEPGSDASIQMPVVWEINKRN